MAGLFSTDTGPGQRSGAEQAAEVGPGADGAEGLAGGHAGSSGGRVAPGGLQPGGDLQSSGHHSRAVFSRAA